MALATVSSSIEASSGSTDIESGSGLTQVVPRHREGGWGTRLPLWAPGIRKARTDMELVTLREWCGRRFLRVSRALVAVAVIAAGAGCMGGSSGSDGTATGAGGTGSVRGGMGWMQLSRYPRPARPKASMLHDHETDPEWGKPVGRRSASDRLLPERGLVRRTCYAEGVFIARSVTPSGASFPRSGPLCVTPPSSPPSSRLAKSSTEARNLRPALSYDDSVMAPTMEEAEPLIRRKCPDAPDLTAMEIKTRGASCSAASSLIQGYLDRPGAWTDPATAAGRSRNPT